MIRSMALASVLALTLASGWASADPLAPPGSSAGSRSGGCIAPNCEGPPDGIQRVPPGYYRPAPPSSRPPHPRPPYHYDPGPPDGYYLDYPRDNYGRFSCEDARRILYGQRFRSVRALDCRGRQYQFRATRDGKRYLVNISAISGRILSLRRI